MIPLFKWDAKEGVGGWSYNPPSNCPYCTTKLQHTELRPAGHQPHEDARVKVCPRCGFEVVFWIDGYEGWGQSGDVIMGGDESRLLQFSVDSPQLALDEVAAYLKVHRDAILQISPRRFEELIADCYRNSGWDVTLTQATRDGGYDLVLLQNGSAHCIVECKRHSNTLGVGLVRQLAGVCLDLNIRRAKLVATTSISADAQNLADRLSHRGYEIDLLDAEAVFELLNIYNTELPKVNSLNEALLVEIQGRLKST